MEKSKEISFLIILVLFAFLSSTKAQVSINHVQLKLDSIGYDSVRIDYTSNLGKCDFIEGLSHGVNGCHSRLHWLVFKDSLHNQSFNYDTTLKVGPHSFFTQYYELWAVWDTAPNPFPPSPRIVMDSFIYDNCNITSLADYEKKMLLKLFPIPADDVLLIETNIIPISVELYTLNGRLVQSFSTFKSNLNVSQLPNGIYLLRIRDKKQTITKKIMVKH